LCRCTGYTKILDAIEEYTGQAVADTPDGVPS
jgi:aerobic-type carbon monoxide dehydrogenase small subunit (CoxS/CutS family)